ncbi:MAG: HAD hydrolase-like protein [Acidobacteria bacterium]|nr:HAD hydrolase-like protein [Acidobacteriota bacterium]
MAARALEGVRRRFPDAGIGPDHVLVVGDTPHDIDCAKAIGARTVAVASGVFTVPALESSGAWVVFDRLPEPPVFERVIDRQAAEPSS